MATVPDMPFEKARRIAPCTRLHSPLAGLLLALLVLGPLGFWSLQRMLAPESLIAWLAMFTMCF
jgi:hypothetical protein